MSASPACTARANAAIAPSKRQTWSRVTTPLTTPVGRPDRGERGVERGLGPPFGPGEVAQHRSGLDGRQLVGVAHQHEPGLRAHRVEQPGHHRQGDHRRLVHHHDVVGQPLGPAVAERAAAPPAQQPVQGGGVGHPRREAARAARP